MGPCIVVFVPMLIIFFMPWLPKSDTGKTELAFPNESEQNRNLQNNGHLDFTSGFK